MICDELKLMGGDMFAIDGCKLPCNASKSWSGTKWELKQKKKKLEAAARWMLKRYCDTDAMPIEEEQKQREVQAAQSIRDKAKRIKGWLADNDDKPGKSGKPKKSNITDNDSAKMKTSKGVIQGYDGVACVDAKHQVIVQAEAFGEAQGHDLLQPMVKQTKQYFHAPHGQDIFKTTKLTADSDFYNTANVTHLYQNGIGAYIPNLGFRKRDPRFVNVERYRDKKEKQAYYGRQSQHYTSPDFHYDAATHTCICPAGKKLYSNGRANNLGGNEA